MNLRGIGHFAGSHISRWMLAGILTTVEAVQILGWAVSVFFSIGVVCMAVLGGMHLWAPENYYSLTYNVPQNHVYIQAKPHDREWEKAPIGKKYCHYDRQVTHDRNQVVVGWQKVDE